MKEEGRSSNSFSFWGTCLRVFRPESLPHLEGSQVPFQRVLGTCRHAEKHTALQPLCLLVLNLDPCPMEPSFYHTKTPSLQAQTTSVVPREQARSYAMWLICTGNVTTKNVVMMHKCRDDAQASASMPLNKKLGLCAAVLGKGSALQVWETVLRCKFLKFLKFKARYLRSCWLAGHLLLGWPLFLRRADGSSPSAYCRHRSGESRYHRHLSLQCAGWALPCGPLHPVPVSIVFMKTRKGIKGKRKGMRGCFRGRAGGREMRRRSWGPDKVKKEDASMRQCRSHVCCDACLLWARVSAHVTRDWCTCQSQYSMAAAVNYGCTSISVLQRKDRVISKNA